jgi:type IV secretory pathway VirB2 component (pilin)
MVGSCTKRWLNVAVWLGVFFLLSIGSAYAGSSGNLPFNSAIDSFQKNFYAWIAIACIILWVATCLMLAFGEWGDGMKRLLNILFWMALSLGGVTAVPAIFGTGAVI